MASTMLNVYGISKQAAARMTSNPDILNLRELAPTTFEAAMSFNDQSQR